MFNFHNSLKSRVIGLILTIFISIFAMAFYFASQFIMSSQKAIANEFLQQQVLITEEKAFSFFEREQKLIEFGLEKGVYQAWMKAPDDNFNLGEATDDLQTTCSLTECYGWFLVSHDTKKGVSYNIQTDEVIEDNLEPSDLVWYQPIIDSGKDVFIDSTYGSNFNTRAVFLDYVVREDDEVLGIVGTYELIDDVVDELLIRDDKAAINFVIDEENKLHISDKYLPDNKYGKSLAATNQRDWSSLVSATQWDKITAVNEAGLSNTLFTLTLESNDYLAAFRLMEPVGWYTVSLYPKSKLLEGFNYGQIFAVSFVFLLLFLMMTLFGLNSLIIAPLTKLNDVVKSIKQGNYNFRAGKVGLDSIQNLADGIDEMSMKISSQIESLNESNKELKITSLKAKKANKAKSEFLSNMSHEIRTPLNGIYGTLQLIKDKQADSNSQKLVDKALYSAKSLLVIINDILDFSKIEANKIELENNAFSFIDIIESVVSDTNPNAVTKGIRIEKIIDENFVDGWLGDSVRVKQILLNLVSNAVKFTDQGKVSIRLSKLKKEGKDTLAFHVIDSGIGMSQEFQKQVFDRFSQADSSTTRKYGGTGLGMSIIVNLVKLMNGSIDIESSEGSGTIVSVELPLKRTQLQPGTKQEKSENHSVPELSGFKILIAEDNDINQAIIESMLTPTAAELTFVDNGKKAVAACNKKSFDIVLMDIQMPEMDGEEAFKLIVDSNQQIPIIALTANTMEDDIKRYQTLGFTSHIGKPIEMNILYSTLSDVLKTENRKQIA